MRTHGWGGDPPADDEEAVRRILEAARACIDREGPGAGVADVAKELGVTRQTVYRYFRTTEDLLSATALDAAAGFLDRVEAHLANGPSVPAAAVVEGIAFTLERLPEEPYLGLLLEPGRFSIFSQGITSANALALGRSIIDRFAVDWEAHGFDDRDLDELVEHMLRITLSLVIDQGSPPRTGSELRGYLDRWLAPAVERRPTRRA